MLAQWDIFVLQVQRHHSFVKLVITPLQQVPRVALNVQLVNIAQATHSESPAIRAITVLEIT